VQITVNGESKIITEMSLLQFLESLGINPRGVAVELNTDIVSRTAYETTILRDGDRMEIVHFVGGG
jgi:sulfur carrier protein